MFKNKNVFAFAGIGNPQKFYDSLKQMGIFVQLTADFPDHYYYTRFDVDALKSKAGDMALLTTEKDVVKLPKDTRQNIFVVPGKFIFDNPDEAWNLLQGVWDVFNSSSETSSH